MFRVSGLKSNLISREKGRDERGGKGSKMGVWGMVAAITLKHSER